MSGETYLTFRVADEVDRFFDESSRTQGESPRLALIVGPVATGKTTLRKENYKTGFVVVDSVEIFLNMSRGEYHAFPNAFLEPMDIFGRLVASRAIQERRNIVTEIIGADLDELKALIEAMTSIGYKVDVQFVHCDLETAVRRNLDRGDDAISAYHAGPFNVTWLMEAARAVDPGPA